MSEPVIADVSDTALWVATYRAVETERPDALFHDRLAARLVGERGPSIARRMKGSRYTSWSVVIRTCIIDGYIRDLVAGGVDTVLNLGAGLDTRPYRLDVPAALHWIEVDFPHIIALKNDRLRDESPRCRLERVALDLTDRAKRTALFDEIASKARNVLVLTEGVVPYLDNDQAAALADDLRSRAAFRHWILDYFNAGIVRYMRRARWRKQMKNAPIRFAPADWAAFFQGHGWKVREMRYHFEEGQRLGRPVPLPWWMRVVRSLIPSRFTRSGAMGPMRQAAGYALLEPSSAYK